jgi:WD40 repeat protein
MQWSPDGKVLAVLDKSDSVRLLKENSLLKTVSVLSNAMVRSAALSRDRQILAFADDKGIYLRTKMTTMSGHQIHKLSNSTVVKSLLIRRGSSLKA